MTELKFRPFPNLNSDRLVLRKLVSDDKNEIYSFRSDEQVNAFIQRPNHTNIKSSAEFIDKINKGIDDGKWVYWAITLKNIPELIGTICLWNFSDDYKIVEIGYELLPLHQNQGLMSEAVKSVINYAFEILNIKRIEAYSHRENISSRKLLERNKFKLDPTKKDRSNPDYVVYFLTNR